MKLICKGHVIEDGMCQDELWDDLNLQLLDDNE